jgi:hypothetical protein
MLKSPPVVQASECLPWLFNERITQKADTILIVADVLRVGAVTCLPE